MQKVLGGRSAAAAARSARSAGGVCGIRSHSYVNLVTEARSHPTFHKNSFKR